MNRDLFPAAFSLVELKRLMESSVINSKTLGCKIEIGSKFASLQTLVILSSAAGSKPSVPTITNLWAEVFSFVRERKFLLNNNSFSSVISSADANVAIQPFSSAILT